MRQPLGATAAAALLLMLLAGTADAVSINGPQGPGVILLEPGEVALFNNLFNGLLEVSAATIANKTIPEREVGIAAAPAGGGDRKTVLKLLGTAMASAVLASEATTLGQPKAWKYTDGTGRVALYRLPKGTPKGTCIFIHGCKHDPYSWFYRSRACPQCTGLPEEVSHSKQCLARGYAVLALMSLNREYRNRCFSSSGNPALNDQKSAAAVVRAWTAKFGLARKPKYMFGISSGASFAIKFPMTMKVEGIISEVNMPWEKAWGATDGNGKLKVPFPPTAFYMMARDPQTERQINAAIRIFKANKVNSQYVYVPPVPVTKNFLSNRSVFISPAQSAQIQAALRKIGVLDANGFIKYDVRFSRGWIKNLNLALPWLKREGFNFNLISDESQIWQELNVAYSQHEIVSDYVRPTLMWLEKGGRQNLTTLVNQYSLKGKISCLTESYEGCRG